MSSSVKQQVIQDMQLAGLAAQTQRIYLDHIVRFVRRTQVRPQDAGRGDKPEEDRRRGGRRGYYRRGCRGAFTGHPFEKQPDCP